MEVLNTVQQMKLWSRNRRQAGKTIGFVPTMGYLHEGHLSLMRQAREQNDFLVTSIFVNPTQFGRNEDLDSYPKAPEADSRKCEECGVDALFMPRNEDMYRPNFQTYVEVEKVSGPLCGASRPGHFRGVATVVLKLFNIVQASSAYFGEKDYQQLQVIKTMARDLDLPVSIVPCSTVRDSDGLAMSSRNSYLSSEERKQAVCLHQALETAEELFRSGEAEPDNYLKAMSDRIGKEPLAEIDYVELVHPQTLQRLANVDALGALAVMAVRIGKTRLIDNKVLGSGFID
ncbi:MAG: pantoate--beta-alanine ligase [Desulfomonile tiedjei]|uniref:Pantothenate synthetase n=1 Tax=Desulfomonile tiedjei TaxID=2358 RepID=A0A9D6V942_9BACT|nr:pantoate--beta-alanine ligase [Desulfomonile tiedjei]